MTRVLNQRPWTAYAAVILTTALWGSNPALTRLVLASIGPITLAWLRWLIVLVILMVSLVLIVFLIVLVMVLLVVALMFLVLVIMMLLIMMLPLSMLLLLLLYHYQVPPTLMEHIRLPHNENIDIHLLLPYLRFLLIRVDLAMTHIEM